MMHRLRNDFAEKATGRLDDRALLACFNGGSRTVADIVKHDPGLVSEVWCRKILRQLLQSLERQHAMRLAPFVITPETVLIRDDGEATVLVTRNDPWPSVSRDLAALAGVIHYAITRERTSLRPLRGRALAGYSNSIITSIDRSMDPDPAARPQTVDELRAMLGIVALREVPRTARLVREAPLPALPRQASYTSPQPAWGGPHGYWPQWILGGSTAMVIGILLGMLGSSGGFSLPGEHGRPRLDVNDARRTHTGTTQTAITTQAKPAIPAAGAAAASATGPETPDPTDDTPTYSTDEIARIAKAREDRVPALAPARKQASDLKRDPPANARTRNLPKQDAAPNKPAQLAQQQLLPTATQAETGNIVLDLQVQPWGTVYIDGVNRGVSPPLKHLTVSPGRHSILVQNPTSKPRAFEVDTSSGGRRITVDFTSHPN